MPDRTLLPCEDCGHELFGDDRVEETTALVDVTAEPVFAGRKGQAEVPALRCPECDHVTPL